MSLLPALSTRLLVSVRYAFHAPVSVKLIFFWKTPLT